ncbi:hypothetical protein GGR53DRAFT_396333 [Hypoxylon sp. FL1150]|nr:hypothetical protein GGR53DRAFT_396333 [Hypoxylon sp. FL1150]
MDGPVSRLPSSSVASVTTANLAAHRSVKESFDSAPVTPSSNSSYNDPPRPAKEGHEWVWFPAGYWAEREIVEAPGKVIRHFKWRKRSGKGSSGRATEDDAFWDQTQRTPKLPSIPNSFITEESYVISLQRPPASRQGTSSESGSAFPLLRTPQAELPSPYLTEEAHVLSLQRSPLSHHMNSHANGSGNGTSLSKLSRPIQSSPLTIEKGDSDTTPTPVPTPLSISIGQSRRIPSSSPPLSLAVPDDKPKKSFIARLLPEHRPRMKKIHSDNDAYDFTACAIEGVREQLLAHRSQSPPTPIMSRVASLLLRDEGGGVGKRTWSRPLKLFGKSPWHRQTSAGSEASATSSLRDALRGQTPTASPASDAGPLKLPDLQFPGGEARRVKTPPLREGNQHRCQPRSFFFDIATPPSGSISSYDSGEWRLSRRPRSPPPTAAIVREDGDYDRKKKDSAKEWWEVPVAVPRYEAMAPASFKFDMPEHLPSSPMCPTNARHKSGGTGVCVYHGRKKKSGGTNNGENSDGRDDDADVWT